MSPISNAELNTTVEKIIRLGWQTIPENFSGTGAPGNYLEYLFGIDGGNQDTPDAGNWEIKFHGGTSLMTLFHQQSRPQGCLMNIIQEFGWKNNNGFIAFRHTIRGGGEATPRGFFITNEREEIQVRNIKDKDRVLAFWPHDLLINRFASKFRRLVVVSGERSDRQICYKHADFFAEPKITRLINAIENGLIAIDFDARTSSGAGLRDHGTKFRIKYRDLPYLYHRHERYGR